MDSNNKINEFINEGLVSVPFADNVEEAAKSHQENVEQHTATIRKPELSPEECLKVLSITNEVVIMEALKIVARSMLGDMELAHKLEKRIEETKKQLSEHSI